MVATHLHQRDGDEPVAPRIRVVKGSPWRVGPSIARDWTKPAFVGEHAKPIIQIGDRILRTPARRPSLSTALLRELAGDLFASMIVARGIGIAAPQIGIPLRVAIMDVDWAGIVAVNPEVDWVSDETEETSEACLSVRGFAGMIDRPLRCRVSAQDVAGKRFIVEGEGWGAQCLLHEVDHLNGVLYVDHARSPDKITAVTTQDMDDEPGQRVSQTPPGPGGRPASRSRAQ